MYGCCFTNIFFKPNSARKLFFFKYLFSLFHVAHGENLHCWITVRPYFLTGMSLLKNKETKYSLMVRVSI